MHSSHMLREGARPEIVRDNMGHENIDVTRNVYSKSWPTPRTAMSAKGPALSQRAREGQGTRFFWC